MTHQHRAGPNGQIHRQYTIIRGLDYFVTDCLKYGTDTEKLRKVAPIRIQYLNCGTSVQLALSSLSCSSSSPHGSILASCGKSKTASLYKSSSLCMHGSLLVLVEDSMLTESGVPDN